MKINMENVRKCLRLTKGSYIGFLPWIWITCYSHAINIYLLK
jgi:hypothetical protein